MDDYQNKQLQGGSRVVVDSTATGVVLRKSFLWMALGLAITGLTSYLAFDKGWFYQLQGGVFMGLIIAELILVWVLSGLINKLSTLAATALFVAYSVLNGLSMSFIFAVYEMGSIATTFFVTAGTFGAMALYGYTTKRDLSKLGSILMMAVIGLIIATLVNIFLKNDMFSLLISIAGVVIFVGLTAWDVQKVKAISEEMDTMHPMVDKVAILGALTLYLDFVNLFLYLLRILGRSRN